MKHRTFLFGMTLLFSAIAVNERVHASGAPPRDVQSEQHGSHASSSSSTAKRGEI